MTRDPCALVGVPYHLGACDPETGFDCWALVEYVRREYFALPTPLVAPEGAGVRAAARALDRTRELARWGKVPPPGLPGDVAAMRYRAGAELAHVGVILDAGVLHAWAGVTSGGVGSVVLTPWARLGHWFAEVEVYRVV